MPIDRFIAFLLATLLLLLFSHYSLACDNSKHQGNLRRELEDDPPFALFKGGTRSPSPHRRAAVDAGWCATPDLTPDEKLRERQALAQYRAAASRTARLGGGGGGCFPTVTVETVWIVLHNGPTGQLQEADIDQQLQVLNNAFADHGFAFALRGVHYYNNPTWFANCGVASQGFKRTIRQELDPSDTGSNRRNVLFVYSCNPSGVLGYAYRPSQVAAIGYRDGTVIRYSTLPGGIYSPYNQGHTATHEVSDNLINNSPAGLFSLEDQSHFSFSICEFCRWDIGWDWSIHFSKVVLAREMK